MFLSLITKFGPQKIAVWQKENHFEVLTRSGNQSGLTIRLTLSFRGATPRVLTSQAGKRGRERKKGKQTVTAYFFFSSPCSFVPIKVQFFHRSPASEQYLLLIFDISYLDPRKKLFIFCHWKSRPSG